MAKSHNLGMPLLNKYTITKAKKDRKSPLVAVDLPAIRSPSADRSGRGSLRPEKPHTGEGCGQSDTYNKIVNANLKSRSTNTWSKLFFTDITEFLHINNPGLADF